METLFLCANMARSKSPFAPIDPANVRMYVCGPTVHDLARLGNARSAVVFDQLRRVLSGLFPRVTFVRNVTDVDDKILARVLETGESVGDLTRRAHSAYPDDTAALGVAPPDIEPRATEHVGDMAAMVSRLLASGNAYLAEGHVLFEAATDPRRGALSGQDAAGLRAGARVEPAPWKRDPADFVLRKPAAPGQVGWDGPWGFGRPGWHIECSAMAGRHLGSVFDIHGGGHDLAFPHHENEIAQSTAAHGTDRMANWWMHNGMITVDGAKMSKGAGKFTTVRDLLGGGPRGGEALRPLLLPSHYRQALDFTQERLASAGAVLDRFHGILRDAPPAGGEPDPGVRVALLDDMNTPEAIAALHALASRAAAAAGSARRTAADLRASGALMGLLGTTPDAWFRRGGGTAEDAWVQAAVDAREAARGARRWAEADAIRAGLGPAGVSVEDGPP